MEAATPVYTYKSNLGKRIGATIIDYAIVMLAIQIYTDYFGTPDSDGKIHMEGLAALPVFGFWFLYMVVVEAFFGATLGHRAFYLRVVTLNRGEISLGQALKRRLLDPIDIFWGIPALIAISKSEKKQRLGDMWAGTIVVDTNDPAQYPQAITKS